MKDSRPLKAFPGQVITAYTVRAKQGKAQLHHLRQGGPGRMSAGGGIRARETERLFSRICEVFDLFFSQILQYGTTHTI